MRYRVRGGRLVDASGERAGTDLGVANGRIVNSVDTDLVIDVDGAIITPGFLDVHTHGGGGYNLHTTDPDEIRAYARWAPSSGTTSFLAGVVGVPGAMPEGQLRAAADATENPGPGAEPLGIHMEGPYINVERRGAHDPSWLRMPDEAETTRILDLSRGHLRLVTIAPELPGADRMIRTLVDAGITLSIGHTDATYEQARDALSLGITHATHCFNAMRPLLHRAPGPLGAVIEAESVRGELIGDGVHVHPAAMRALIGALGPERVVVVTDALTAAGLPSGAVLEFAGQEATVEGGVARLADGTITGSVLTMAQALCNLVTLAAVPLPEAVGMLSRNPARAAGVDGRKGMLAPGHDADLLVFDDALNLQAAICKGTLAWATDSWRDRLACIGGERP